MTGQYSNVPMSSRFGDSSNKKSAYSRQCRRKARRRLKAGGSAPALIVGGDDAAADAVRDSTY
jgi:hypothetical protein